jgi:hypothetical protein
MKKIILASLLSILSTHSFAQNGDLVLKGEKWIAAFKGYVCSKDGQTVQAPKGFADLNVVFETLTTDATLDNGLIKAKFTAKNKVVCNYSALIFADNAAYTMRLVESKAFTPANKLRFNTACDNGKMIIDAALESNEYLYYGKPHNIALMAPVEGSEKVCGALKRVGINFVVSGRIQK